VHFPGILGWIIGAILIPIFVRWFDRRVLKVRISTLPGEDEEKEWKEAQKRHN
jgi:hypothetical protein